MVTVTAGKTTYTVEPLEGDAFLLTGPRGAQLVAGAFINNQDLFHAWRVGGTHADLKVNGQLAKFTRAELEGK
jgi:hypothetical protein